MTCIAAGKLLLDKGKIAHDSMTLAPLNVSPDINNLEVCAESVVKYNSKSSLL